MTNWQLLQRLSLPISNRLKQYLQQANQQKQWHKEYRTEEKVLKEEKYNMPKSMEPAKAKHII